MRWLLLSLADEVICQQILEPKLQLLALCKMTASSFLKMWLVPMTISFGRWRINLFFLPLLWVQIFCTWKNVGPSIHYSRLHFLFPSLFLPITSVSPQLLRLITVRHKPLRLPKLKAAEYSSWGQYSKRWQIGNSLFSSKKEYYSLSDNS